MASIAPSERLRRELDETIAGAGDEHDPIEAIGRLGARLILQQALEDELSEFLGRERYERRGEPIAHRNGYEPVTVKTTAARSSLSGRACATPPRSTSRARSSARAWLGRTRWKRSCSRRSCAVCRCATSRQRSRRRSTSRSSRSRPSRGSAWRGASGTGPGVAGAWTSTTSSTASSTRST